MSETVISSPEPTLNDAWEDDEGEFFQTDDELGAIVGLEDLEAAVRDEEKPHLKQLTRYWVKKPFAFVVVYENTRESEKRYVVVEPRLSQSEAELIDFLRDKIERGIDFSKVPIDPSIERRRQDIRAKLHELLQRYNLKEGKTRSRGPIRKIYDYGRNFLGGRNPNADPDVEQVPKPVDPDTGRAGKLSKKQIKKFEYYILRDFVDYDRIDPIKNDINVEDISCNAPDKPIFVDHTQFGEIVTNVRFPEDELDDFVIRLAGSGGKGLSKRQPNIDVRLRDGSRAQLTLGTEVTDRGTNFTIRQFKDVPFTPVDLVNWGTYNLDQMVYLWLMIEDGKSGVIAGGTSSGKTTTMNALSLFIPGTSKVVSIEDTRELEIPQSNWVPHKTRDSFREGGAGEINEYDLLEDSLRKNPTYVIMGEVRGEEGRTLFQMMSTGHYTYTTFHADNPQEVANRMRNDPINVPNAMFESLDFVTIQREVNIEGREVRRNKTITEVEEVTDSQDSDSAGSLWMNTVFEHKQSSDRYRKQNSSILLDQIKNDRGWSQRELEKEKTLRKIVLSYLIKHDINTYAAVAATLQAYMSAPEKVLALIAQNELKDKVSNFHQMMNIDIDIDEAEEALVPRPSPSETTRREVDSFLSRHDDLIQRFSDYNVDFGDEDTGEPILVTSPGRGRDIEEQRAVTGEESARAALDGDVDIESMEVNTDEIHLGVAVGELQLDGDTARLPDDDDFAPLFEDDNSEHPELEGDTVGDDLGEIDDLVMGENGDEPDEGTADADLDEDPEEAIESLFEDEFGESDDEDRDDEYRDADDNAGETTERIFEPAPVEGDDEEEDIDDALDSLEFGNNGDESGEPGENGSSTGDGSNSDTEAE